jgi:hypothetical protein
MSPSCQPLGGVVSPGLTSYRVRQALKIPEIVVMIELTMLLESFGIERSKIPGAIGKTVKEITPLSGIRATLRECGYNPSRGFLEVADSISFLEWIGCNALLLLLDEEFHGSCNLYDKGIASKVVANCIARTISELQPPLGISEVTVPQTPEIPALAESPRCGEIPDSPIHATLDALKSGTPSSVTSPNL